MTDIISTTALADIAQYEDLTRAEAAARIATAEGGHDLVAWSSP